MSMPDTLVLFIVVYGELNILIAPEFLVQFSTAVTKLIYKQPNRTEET